MKDVQFMTAKEKGMVLKQWKTFIKNGFKQKHFTQRLYIYLTLHCSFIAHFDRRGFYATYFSEPNGTARFLAQFDREKGCVSVEYRTSSWATNPDYSDLNGEMCNVVELYKKAIYKACHDEERRRDIETAKGLLARHGIQFEEVK